MTGNEHAGAAPASPPVAPPAPPAPAPLLAALDTARSEHALRDQVRAMRADGLQRGLWRFRLVSGGPR